MRTELPECDGLVVAFLFGLIPCEILPLIGNQLQLWVCGRSLRIRGLEARSSCDFIIVWTEILINSPAAMFGLGAGLTLTRSRA
ncbi:hypothetical protein BGY98DRAFT_966236 [Russula aff. rugulosa BPL654]|nr:hypothetical protein BGY98DRAFT_966236 [Russula aff. rugulosa BPL654]